MKTPVPPSFLCIAIPIMAFDEDNSYKATYDGGPLRDIKCCKKGDGRIVTPLLKSKRRSRVRVIHSVPGRGEHENFQLYCL